MHISTHPLSPSSPVLVIAEIGVNHDGSVRRALELVDEAARAGADAVKLQVFRADSLMHHSSDFAAYQRQRGADADPAAMLRRYELAPSELHQVIAHIRASGLIPLATPFSPADVDTLAALELPAIKIASPDLVNHPLLRRCAALNRPLLISTGASTLNEISTTIGWLRSWDTPFALLHCISSYPADNADANLSWISDLAHRFDVPIGYSDHTTDDLPGALAVAAGACIVEKHLTYDRSAPGPDHAASADPAEFARYVAAIRRATLLRGHGHRRILDAEQDVRRVSRQSLVTARDLPIGHLLLESDLIPQRPGTGIPASALPTLVGQRINAPLAAGTLLQTHMIANMDGEEL